VATAAAKRYARATFELASEQGRVDEWRGQLAALRTLMTEPRVEQVLSNPTIAAEKRMELVTTGDGFSPEVVNLAHLMVEARRVRDIGEVVEAFDELADESAGTIRATVTTAVELPADERDELSRKLSSRLGKQIVLTAKVDPHILGGLKLQYGDRLIDATVATRLQQLRRRLVEA
jgi:F-type H+-transporting ATPase subunit delta